MTAYCHNDAALYEKLLASMEAHAAADNFVHGSYWRGGKGCSVGCAAQSLGLANKADHAALAEATGTSERLQRLNDYIFEELPLAQSKTWPVRFIRAGWDEASGCGRDLSLVPAQFTNVIIARLFAQDWLTFETRAMCQPIIDGLAILAAGGTLTPEQKAGSDKAARAAGAAWAARDAWAARAAGAAWAARAAWAAGAARDAGAAWAAGAAGAAELLRQADDLIRLMMAAPIIERETK